MSLVRIILVVIWAAVANAAMPPVEKALPAETVACVSIPDYHRLVAAFDSSPEGRFWGDPAMKPFREQFQAKWQQQIVQPLQQAFDLPLQEVASYCQGPVALALVRSTDTNRAGALDWVALADAPDKAGQIKKRMDEARRKWFQGGKDVRSSKIADVDITLFSLNPTNDLGKVSAGFGSGTLAIAQIDSLFVTGSSKSAVERVVQSIKGNTQSILAALPEFQHSRWDAFRPMPLSLWVDGKTLLGLAGRSKIVPPPPGSENEAPVDINRLLAATGLEDLEGITCGVSFQSTGTVLDIFMANPEAKRRGLLKILAGQPGEVSPPAFVPADVFSFLRWRLDGRKAWQGLETMIGDISPQWLSAMRLILDTANQAGKLKDPLFDIQTNLVANLGNDVIRYTQTAASGSPAGLYLVSSPEPAQLASALKYLLVFFSQNGEEPAEREFQGHRIYSLPLISALGSAGGTNALVLNYAASSNYVALSTDTHLLESYLAKSNTNSLAGSKGEVFSRVTDPANSLLGYLDLQKALRTRFETNQTALLPSIPGVKTPHLEDWFNPALLPPFEKVQGFFGSLVYGETASPEGLVFRLRTVSPPTGRTAQ